MLFLFDREKKHFKTNMFCLPMRLYFAG